MRPLVGWWPFFIDIKGVFPYISKAMSSEVQTRIDGVYFYNCYKKAVFLSVQS
ncbi:MAG: hypothetical protein SRB2_01118 [Desulfobacteraceae bacterium Eth-SRB2]|nr:MAG: hypothetical protein SRB2_01118 [Desulfobacteraceae bacterium Eth-SRB2]